MEACYVDRDALFQRCITIIISGTPRWNKHEEAVGAGPHLPAHNTNLNTAHYEKFTYVPLAVAAVIVFIISLLLGGGWKANLIYAVAVIVLFISLPFARMAGRKFLESEFYRNNRGSAILVQICGGVAACALAFLINYFLIEYSWEIKIVVPMFFLGLIFNLFGILPIRTRKRPVREL